MKNIFLILLVFCFASVKSQILWSDSFSSQPLQTYTTPLSTTSYTTIPSNYQIINDSYGNNVGYSNAPNKPFNVPALKTAGWAVVYNPIEADTFLVSTSWFDSSSYTSNRYAIAPAVNNIVNNTVLSWNAMAPDASYPDGYEVYVTNNITGTLTTTDFPSNNRVYAISDGNTGGGGEKSTWIKRGVSLASYAGQNLKIAFRNASKNMYQIWIDDITVENLASAFDAEVSTGQIYKYNTPASNGTISCRVTNKGYVDMTGVTLNYSINGAGTQSQTFNLSPAVSVYGYTDLAFTTPYNIATPGYYKVKIWVSNVNSNIDQNHFNDTLNTNITIVTSAPAKSVMVEQFVDCNEGNSPDAQDKLQSLISTSVIAVNVHDVDSLKNSQGATLISTYRKKNSTALIDRNYFSDINSVPVDRNDYSSRINQRLPAVVPVGVTITNKNYSSSNRQVTFTVQANFTGEVIGDYRLNAYLIENNVYGPYFDTTNNGWNQLNNMYNVPWSNYYQKGHFSSGTNGYYLNIQDYMHQHVLTAAPDGVWGLQGIIPLTGGTQGNSYIQSYIVNLPTATNGQFRYNPDNIYIVGFVAEYNSNKNYRTVLNATQVKLTAGAEVYVGIKEAVANTNLFLIYPNPTNGLLNILIPENTFSKKPLIKVSDIIGKEVYSQSSDLLTGLVQINLNYLAAGTYYISLEEGNVKSIKKLILTR